MEGMVFLPSEGSDEGRVLYEQARISLALDLIDANRYKEALVQTEKAIEWPENLGAGKPYDPDNRVQNYLAAYCLKKMNRQTEATHRQNAVLEYNATHIGTSPVYNLLALQIYRERGETRVADDLLQRIMKSDNIDEPVQRWIAGKYNLDEAKIGEFEGPGRDMFIEIINRILGMQ
jgi:tetratricopeptide (TPR) repeat protein